MVHEQQFEEIGSWTVAKLLFMNYSWTKANSNQTMHETWFDLKWNIVIAMPKQDPSNRLWPRYNHDIVEMIWQWWWTEMTTKWPSFNLWDWFLAYFKSDWSFWDCNISSWRHIRKQCYSSVIPTSGSWTYWWTKLMNSSWMFIKIHQFMN